jgi:hypothetical protein
VSPIETPVQAHAFGRFELLRGEIGNCRDTDAMALKRVGLASMMLDEAFVLHLHHTAREVAVHHRVPPVAVLTRALQVDALLVHQRDALGPMSPPRAPAPPPPPRRHRRRPATALLNGPPYDFGGRAMPSGSARR